MAAADDYGGEDGKNLSFEIAVYKFLLALRKRGKRKVAHALSRKGLCDGSIDALFKRDQARNGFIDFLKLPAELRPLLLSSAVGDIWVMSKGCPRGP